MAQITVTIPQFTLASSWEAFYDYQTAERYYTTPTTGTSFKTVDLSAIPAGAKINSATLTGSTNGNGTSRARANSITKNVTNSFNAGVTDWFSGLTAFSSLEIRFQFQAFGGTGTGGNPAVTYSRSSTFKDVALTIDYTPPASVGTLDKPGVDAGREITLTIVPTGADASHSVVWALGAYSKTQAVAAGVLSTAFAPPMEWLNALPGAVIGAASCTLITYRAGAETGRVSYGFNIAVPQSVVPVMGTFNAALVDGFEGMYIKGRSKAALSISGSHGAYGSTITACHISGGGYSASASTLLTGALNAAGDTVFTATVTDSRGRTATGAVTVTVEPYQAPYFTSLGVYRANSAGAADNTGDCIGIRAAYACSAVGTNAVSCSVQYRQAPDGTPTQAQSVTSGTALVIGKGAISTEKSYLVTLTLSDSLSTVTRVVTIPTAKYLLYGMPEAKALGVGKATDRQGYIDSAFGVLLPDGATSSISALASDKCIVGAKQKSNAFTPLLRTESASGHRAALGGTGELFGLMGMYAGQTADTWGWSLMMDMASGTLSNAGRLNTNTLSVGGSTPLTGQNVNNLLTILSSGGLGTVQDYWYAQNGGYFSFKKSGSNAIVLQWKLAAISYALTAWNNVFYTDVSMGNWYKPFLQGAAAVFTGLYQPEGAAVGWAGGSWGANSTFAGNARIFSGSKTAVARTVYVFAIGYC